MVAPSHHRITFLALLAVGCTDARQRPGASTPAQVVDAALSARRHVFGERPGQFALLGTWTLAERGDCLVMAGPEAVVLWDIGADFQGTELWRGKGNGGASALASGDMQGDGTDELLVGWGMHPDAMAVPATLEMFRFVGGTNVERSVVTRWPTPRAQFSALQVGPGIAASYFESKYDVRTVIIEPNDSGQTERVVQRGRLAAHVAIDDLGAPNRMIAVGRPYGDQPKSDGDIRILFGDSVVQLPSVRGVRSAAWVSVGQPVQDMLCYGAGWHWRYQEQAKGVLTCAWPTQPQAARADLWEVVVVDTVGSFEVSQIESADLDGDGAKELVVRTPSGAVAYHLMDPRNPAGGWRPRVLGPCGASMAVGDFDGDRRPEVACAGEQIVFYEVP